MTTYHDAISQIMRTHGMIHEAIEGELRRHKKDGLTSTQALLLYNIGDNELTMRQLMTSGCYLGTNVTYNINKLEEHGWVVRHRKDRDKRAVYVKLSKTGQEIRAIVGDAFDNHAMLIPSITRVTEADLDRTSATLRGVEVFLVNQGAYIR